MQRQEVVALAVYHSLCPRDNQGASRADAAHIKCVLPTAPQMPVTLNGGARMNAWYDLYGLDRINTREDVHNLRLSAE